MKKIVVISLTLLLVFSIKTKGQDIATIYMYGDSVLDLREFLFNNSNGQLNLNNVTSQYLSQESSFTYNIYNNLTCTGDFDGDGKDEVAIFVKMIYTPNCDSGYSCPPYYRTTVILLKSDGNYFHPIGSWYSELDSIIDAAKIRFAVSGDFNKDGKTDIAFVYSDSTKVASLMVLKSNGNSFSNPVVFYNALPTNYKLDSVMYALSGDYNGDGYSDMALIYENNTVKNINVFTSNGTDFNTPKIYYTFPNSFYLNQIQFALSGKFTSGIMSNIALLYKSYNVSQVDSGNIIVVLKAKVDSFATPKTYLNLTSNIDNYNKVLFATTSDFNNDGLSDIALAFDTQTGTPDVQQILVIHSHDTLFAPPINYWNTNTNLFDFNYVKHLVAGKFAYTPTTQVCTWQGNKQGALTFSFDDGYDSTIIFAKYLYSKGVSGTHNIITQFTGTSNFVSWQSMQADTLGNEYASHSQTHPFFDEITLNAAESELIDSKQDLTTHLSTDAESFVFPDGAFTNDVLQSSALRNNYLSARTSMEGYNLSTPIDRYALSSQIVYYATDTTTLFGWINNTVNYGYWTFLMMHYVGSDTGIYSNSVAKFNAVVDYACNKNLWINTHEHIFKYIEERNSLKPINYTVLNTNTIKLNLDDGLNDSVYNVPLTIKVSLPICMNDSVAVMQNNIIKHYPVVNENGTFYSYINCLPNTVDVFITNFNHYIVTSNTICQGTPFVVGTHSYTSSGTYLDSLKTALGCDSIVKTILTVNPKYNIQKTHIICQGDTIMVGIHIYGTSGTYKDTLTTSLGCDSIITTVLTVKPKYNIQNSLSICQGGSIFVGIHTYNTSGTYKDTLTTSLGCDSIITTVLTVKPKNNIQNSLSICQGGSIFVGVHTYNTSGTYKDTLTTSLGCDSIITTVLTVKPKYNIQNSLSICQGSSIIVGIHTYNTSGTYKDTLTTSLGCDSIITTVLTEITPPSDAGVISGLGTVCQGQAFVIYSIPSILNATNYIWTLPTGFSGSSITNSISLNFGTNAATSDIQVYGHNECGNGNPSLKNIIINSTLPDSAKTITSIAEYNGDTVCLGENNVPYSTAAILNATSYLWYYTGNGATIIGNSNNVTINFSSIATSGDLIVYGHNACGDGTFSPFFPINIVICSSIKVNNDSTEYNIYPNPVVEMLTIETNSNKEQRLEIINLFGQTVYTSSIINKKTTINTSAFASGVYILKLYTDKETVVRKFIKQ